jgi:hypothetical protein
MDLGVMDLGVMDLGVIAISDHITDILLRQMSGLDRQLGGLDR